MPGAPYTFHGLHLNRLWGSEKRRQVGVWLGANKEFPRQIIMGDRVAARRAIEAEVAGWQVMAGDTVQHMDCWKSGAGITSNILF